MGSWTECGLCPASPGLQAGRGPGDGVVRPATGPALLFPPEKGGSPCPSQPPSWGRGWCGAGLVFQAGLTHGWGWRGHPAGPRNRAPLGSHALLAAGGGLWAARADHCLSQNVPTGCGRRGHTQCSGPPPQWWDLSHGLWPADCYLTAVHHPLGTSQHWGWAGGPVGTGHLEWATFTCPEQPGVLKQASRARRAQGQARAARATSHGGSPGFPGKAGVDGLCWGCPLWRRVLGHPARLGGGCASHAARTVQFVVF